MDEILYLEQDEEITSVIDKLKKSESGSVGLVIPRNCTLVHSIVNLKLLKKEAQNLNKEIALVTADKIGKNIAGQIGLVVYEDVHSKRPANPVGMSDRPKGDEVIEVDMSAAAAGTATENAASGGSPAIKHYALESEVGKVAEASAFATKEIPDDQPIRGNDRSFSPARHRSSQPNKLKKGALVALAIFLLLGAATVLGLPQTQVVVTVAAESFEKNISLMIDSEAKEVDQNQKIIPGQLLEVTNEDAKRVVATGKKDVGTKAKGPVTVTNSFQVAPWKIPAGTVFVSPDNKSFKLVSDMTVPGPTFCQTGDKLGICPGSASGTLEAAEPGDSYNIKAGKFTISGLSDAQKSGSTAESTKDFSGGSSKTVSTMTAEDVENATAALSEDLKKQAIEEFKKQAKDLKLIEDAIEADKPEVETNPGEIDSETEYFDIKIKNKHRAIVFNDQQVQDIVLSELKKEVPSDKELILSEGDEFAVAVLNKNYKEKKLELESRVKTKIGTKVNDREVKQGLNGRKASEARDILAKVPNVKDVAIHTFPRWWWQEISYMAWNTRLRVIYE